MEKFKPVSPDPSLIKDEDQAIAKFGHLNKLVDFANSLLPLTGVDNPGALSVTPKFIGQMFINTNTGAIWVAVSLSSWNLVKE